MSDEAELQCGWCFQPIAGGFTRYFTEDEEPLHEKCHAEYCEFLDDDGTDDEWEEVDEEPQIIW